MPIIPAETCQVEMDFDYHREIIDVDKIEKDFDVGRVSPNDLVKPKQTWVSPEMDQMWMDNYTQNKKFIRPSFNKKERWKTCILVGGSPAIKRNVYFLKNLSDDFVIISPNTTVKYLMDKGIKPNYVFAIEGKPHISKDFDFDSTGMTLITSPFVCPDALTKWRGEIYTHMLSGGTKYKEAFNADWAGKVDIDIGGGNVVSSAYLWAYKYLDIRHFVIIGMSLCYYDAKHYYFDDREKPNDPLEHWEKWLKAVDMYGNIVSTSPALIMYKTWLETYTKYALEYGGGSFINATEDGILGTIPEIVERDGTKVRFKPKYIPWMNITPLYMAIEAHKKRMEDFKNGTRK